MKDRNGKKRQNSGSNSLNKLDNLVTRGTQIVSHRMVSRRSFLNTVTKVMLAATGATLMHVLPIDREFPVASATSPDCNEWYMCGIYAIRVCSCACGSNNCPSGTSNGNNPWSACCWSGQGSIFIRVYYYDCCCSGSCSNPCCSQSNCDCDHVGAPHVWCGGVSGAKLCCTRVAMTGLC